MIFSQRHNNNNFLKKTPQQIRNYGPTKRVILFTNARNEENIREWAAHHLLLGFDCIYIFDHKSNPPLNTYFKNFDKRVIIERCELKNPVKLKLMQRAVSISRTYNADWFLYLDADEFLVLNNYKGVKHMLNNFNHADSLSINWLMFGTNNHKKTPSGLIMENYTKSQLNVDQHVKTFVRPNEVVNAINPHYYYIRNPLRMISINNKIMNANNYAFNTTNTDKTFNETPSYIAHYVYQSEETYVKRKVLLEADDSGIKRKRDLTIHNRYNNVDNKQLLDKYSNNVKLFLHYYNEKK